MQTHITKQELFDQLTHHGIEFLRHFNQLNKKRFGEYCLFNRDQTEQIEDETFRIIFRGGSIDPVRLIKLVKLGAHFERITERSWDDDSWDDLEKN